MTERSPIPDPFERRNFVVPRTLAGLQCVSRVGAHGRQEDLERFDILLTPVGSDPRYALQTRKGTGYYKVPSLKGVWYRGPFGHHGSAATLEDWLDPARLSNSYRPTGYAGPDGRERAVKGHEFGLSLSSADRTA